jgi:hypothetical protein
LRIGIIWWWRWAGGLAADRWAERWCMVQWRSTTIILHGQRQLKLTAKPVSFVALFLLLSLFLTLWTSPFGEARRAAWRMKAKAPSTGKR